jgi:Na+/H+-dicarboxylate symporter
MTAWSMIRNFFRSGGLALATLVGVLGGVCFGLVLHQLKEHWTEREVMYVSFIGNLFLRMLKAIVIPLIVPSLITAVGSLNVSVSGLVGRRAVVYFLLTTFLAVFLGLALAVVIHPGDPSAKEGFGSAYIERDTTTPDTFLDLVRQLVPPNLVQATMQHTRTSLIKPSDDCTPSCIDEKSGDLRNASDPLTWETKQEEEDGTNTLGLIVFAIILGIALAQLGEKGKPLLLFFSSLSDVMMVITTWIIYLAPVGVFFLVAGQVLGTSNLLKVLTSLGLFVGTAIAGSLIHGFVLLPLIYRLITKKSPFMFIVNMGNALTTAFGTASSSATLPVTMQMLENKNKVDPRISRFVLPIGATVNMDGTALWQAVAAIFISQLNGQQLNLGQYMAVSIAAVGASIGSAGIPGGSIVTLIMVLDTLGLPAGDVTIVLAVDWLLDRFQTVINVLGDSLGAGIVDQLCRDKLDENDNSSSV